MKDFEYEALAATEDRHWWFRALRDEIGGAIRAHFGERTGLRALDAGCGTGGLLAALAQNDRIGNAVGIDYSPLALRFAQGKVSAHLVRGDATRLPFRPASFDLVTCIDVLYAREAYPGFQRALRDMYACLRPGGLLLLQLPAYAAMVSRHDENVHTAHRFVRPEVRNALIAAGFRAPRVFYRYGWLLPIAFLARKLARGSAQASAVRPTAPWLNALLHAATNAERLLGPCRPPFGLSVFAIAAKPPTEQNGGASDNALVTGSRLETAVRPTEWERLPRRDREPQFCQRPSAKPASALATGRGVEAAPTLWAAVGTGGGSLRRDGADSVAEASHGSAHDG